MTIRREMTIPFSKLRLQEHERFLIALEGKYPEVELRFRINCRIHQKPPIVRHASGSLAFARL
jgi:hypothetical protein